MLWLRRSLRLRARRRVGVCFGSLVVIFLEGEKQWSNLVLLLSCISKYRSSSSGNWSRAFACQRSARRRLRRCNGGPGGVERRDVCRRRRNELVDHAVAAELASDVGGERPNALHLRGMRRCHVVCIRKVHRYILVCLHAAPGGVVVDELIAAELARRANDLGLAEYALAPTRGILMLFFHFFNAGLIMLSNTTRHRRGPGRVIVK